MPEKRPVAIVTGASRGIGRAIALALGQANWDCVVNYTRNASAAEEVCRTIASAGATALPVQADIALAPDRQRLLDQAISRFGRVDMLVNNAGIAPEKRADLLEATEESFDRLIATNLKGPCFLTQLVANQMIRQGPSGCKIVNITSISAYAASVNRGDYCITKAGLAMMTQLYAARLAEHGINVYEIRPGIIQTDMTGPVKEKYDKLIFEQDLTPIHRWGQGDDVARAVVAIAQDLFPFSTGQVFDIDGGFHLRRL